MGALTGLQIYDARYWQRCGRGLWHIGAIHPAKRAYALARAEIGIDSSDYDWETRLYAVPSSMQEAA